MSGISKKEEYELRSMFGGLMDVKPDIDEIPETFCERCHNLVTGSKEYAVCRDCKKVIAEKFVDFISGLFPEEVQWLSEATEGNCFDMFTVEEISNFKE